VVWVGAGPLVAVQCADRLDVLAGQLEVEDLDVLLDALRGDRLGEDDIAALDMPAQHDLGRGLADPASNRLDRRIVEDAALSERRPGFDGDLVLGAEPAQLVLGQVGIDLDLVDRRGDVG
jgi:hypothetical protein